MNVSKLKKRSFLKLNLLFILQSYLQLYCTHLDASSLNESSKHLWFCAQKQIHTPCKLDHPWWFRSFYQAPWYVEIRYERLRKKFVLFSFLVQSKMKPVIVKVNLFSKNFQLGVWKQTTLNDVKDVTICNKLVDEVNEVRVVEPASTNIGIIVDYHFCKCAPQQVSQSIQFKYMNWFKLVFVFYHQFHHKIKLIEIN